MLAICDLATITPLTTSNFLDFRVAEKELLKQYLFAQPWLVLQFVVFRKLSTENRLDKLYCTDHFNWHCFSYLLSCPIIPVRPELLSADESLKPGTCPVHTRQFYQCRALTPLYLPLLLFISLLIHHELARHLRYNVSDVCCCFCIAIVYILPSAVHIGRQHAACCCCCCCCLRSHAGHYFKTFLLIARIQYSENHFFSAEAMIFPMYVT